MGFLVLGFTPPRRFSPRRFHSASHLAQVVGFSIFQIQNSRVRDVGVSRFRIKGLGLELRVWDLVFRVWDVGVQVFGVRQIQGFMIQRSRIWVQDRVQDSIPVQL